MTQAFKYRPRFKDIRIKPPKDEPREQEKVCEYPKCQRKADSRAPKGPDRLHEYHWFCQSHAAEYNKSWNFFEGLSESAARSYQDSMAYGHRPTWNFSRGSNPRKRAERASVDWQKAFFDPFSLFGDSPPPGHERRHVYEGPRPGRLQEKALDELGLEFGCEKSAVRKRYAELVRTYHPDSNGGDRSHEERLQKVVAAYQILKSAGMA
ncbi:molecular chaperone DnaJ [Marinicauda algicola]|uniref:Molecular chaperone DnaJ n=1 Tax=Marinicauda algicola TaxID=2029849 RepID=A0A4S2H3T6_9PROT|nr:J domain-containing protein [Marinicauda algicola]TGY90244.1 molecular chaperone DnaJ [Marinicauda algicola]